MAHQKSENREVPQGRRKPAETQEPERPGGGKAVPVKEVDRQLELPFATAERPRKSRGAASATASDRSDVGASKAPKARAKLKTVGPASMEEVVERLEAAFDKVAANKGTPGPDGRTIAVTAHALLQ